MLDTKLLEYNLLAERVLLDCVHQYTFKIKVLRNNPVIFMSDTKLLEYNLLAELVLLDCLH